MAGSSPKLGGAAPRRAGRAAGLAAALALTSAFVALSASLPADSRSRAFASSATADSSRRSLLLAGTAAGLGAAASPGLAGANAYNTDLRTLKEIDPTGKKIPASSSEDFQKAVVKIKEIANRTDFAIKRLRMDRYMDLDIDFAIVASSTPWLESGVNPILRDVRKAFEVIIAAAPEGPVRQDVQRLGVLADAQFYTILRNKALSAPAGTPALGFGLLREGDTTFAKLQVQIRTFTNILEKVVEYCE
eukprot:CAMPEP_0183439802 /NCGR_PEP_ID=MMETSP0370-20130417/79258_1 /TAXON_ID=268820 /ORGANISM="Peridinium aciculiferum, Strain PAER-2" /LENGTH=246 /DNA_ID=CAMNT_0025628401 /DNA_START=58 /DNA_END=798 /DNA_ORIENTATION=-